MGNFFHKLERWFKKEISRKRFLQFSLSGLAAFIAQSQFLKVAFAKDAESTGRPKKTIKTKHDLVVAEGADPFQNTVKAIEALGGMNQFVKKGDVVVIKPNMGWDRTPEQAANTDPNVVAALVEMAYKAGAKRVNIFDVCCNDEKSAYANSGIEKAAKDKGAFVYFPDHWNVVKAKFSYQSGMNGWPILRDAVACDVFINAPVLKHHGLTGLTLSIKNLMGVCSGARGLMHVGIEDKLADLTDFIKPDLTVIDATRVLVRNGPTGGNVADVVTKNKVIASKDPVLADAYAAKLADIEPSAIGYIAKAASRGLGNINISAASIFPVKV